jgi:uncharacterized protein (DUF433 family)
MAAKFGEIVVDLGYITQEQLDEALELQQKGRAKLGRVMVNLMMLNRSQVDDILKYQSSPEHKGKKFGECALEMKLIDIKQLDEAVRYQTTSKGVLGDILIDIGYLTIEQRDEVILKQSAF